MNVWTYRFAVSSTNIRNNYTACCMKLPIIVFAKERSSDGASRSDLLFVIDLHANTSMWIALNIVVAIAFERCLS